MKTIGTTSTPCRACGTAVMPFFSLGDMPLVNSFLKKEEIPKEETFDLTVGFCPKCFLAQLVTVVSPERLYRDYVYLSSVSKPFLEHCKRTAKALIPRLGLTKESLVVEIASNDGVLLQYFKEDGIGILGIDPAKNIAKIANDRGIKTIPEFFNLELATKLASDGTQADLLYGANVLAHVPSIVDFVQGVKALLKPRGTAMFEFPYLEGLFENKFDTIYHEHVFYYSAIALKNLFAAADMEIYDVEQFDLQGGSLRISVCHKGTFPIHDRIKDLVAAELKKGWNAIQPYQTIEKNVHALRAELKTELDSLKKEGKKIAAYGAPAKGNILLNYFGIGSQYIDYIVDITPTKQGLYTPGTHLLVLDPAEIAKDPPDYLLILCWNVADYVIGQYSEYRERGGKFIIPVPRVKIV
jgi:SAM-dependent methyltransferase